MLKPKDILDFWFGPLDADGMPEPEKYQLWFRATRQFDQLLRRRFMSYVTMASENGLEQWEVTPEGRMALILLLDQFSRNIFRGTAMAFENDRQARTLCRAGLARGDDVRLPEIQRAFFYLPLEHSERREDQAECVALYEQLYAVCQEPLRGLIGSFLEYARDHRDIIERFGRFPHRNAILRRANTAAEEDYLQRGAPSFGQ